MNFVLATFLSLLGTGLFVYHGVLSLTDTHHPHWVIGVFYATCYLPFLLAHKVIGPLTDRWRKLPVLLSGHAALVCPVVLTTALKEHLDLGPLMLLGGGLFGLIYVFIPSFRYGLIADCFARSARPRILILSNTAAVMAMSSAPLLHAFLKRMGRPALVTPLIVGLLATSLLLYARLRAAAGSAAFMDKEADAPMANTTAFSVDVHCLIYCGIGICLIGPLQVLVPAMLVDQFELGPIARDFFMALIGVGIVLSVPVSMLLRRRGGRIDLMAVLLMSACCIGMAFAHHIALLTILLLASVIAAGLLVNRNQTLLQARASDRFQGRLMAILASVNMGTPAVTGAIAGFASTAWSVPVAFLAIGVAMTLVAITIETRKASPITEGQAHSMF